LNSPFEFGAVFQMGRLNRYDANPNNTRVSFLSFDWSAQQNDTQDLMARGGARPEGNPFAPDAFALGRFLTIPAAADIIDIADGVCAPASPGCAG
jgi:hypothetical protein